MVAKTLDEFLLFIVKRLWHIDRDVDDDIAPAIAVDSRQALACQSDLSVWLGACWNLHLLCSFDERNLYFSTECGSWEIEEQIVDKVVVGTDELVLLLLIDQDEEVAWSSAVWSCIAVT